MIKIFVRRDEMERFVVGALGKCCIFSSKEVLESPTNVDFCVVTIDGLREPEERYIVDGFKDA